MRKTFLIPLLALLSTAPAPAQTTARTFSYDAAGNRIAMGVPKSPGTEILIPKHANNSN